MGKKARHRPQERRWGAIAAAAVLATPAAADPLPLTPPPQTQSPALTPPQAPQVATPAAPTPPTPPTISHGARALPDGPPQTAAHTTHAAQAQRVAQVPPATLTPTPTALRGETSALPQNLTPLAAPPPPSPPPPPPPAVVAQVAPPVPPPAPRDPPPPPPAHLTPAPTATVNVGVQDTYTRLAFQFQGAATVTPTLAGNHLDLRFSRGADMDIADLRTTPPHLVRDVRRLSTPGAPVHLAMTLDPGVRVRNFSDENRVIVDLLPPDQDTVTTDASGHTAPVPARPPVTGTASVRLIEEANDTKIDVTWPAPSRAAAFRRGEAVWLMFDAAGHIDLRGVAKAGRRHQDVVVVQGQGVIGLRIPAPPDVMVSASVEDNTWHFVLGPSATQPASAQVTRDTNTEGRGRIVAAFGREGVVRWVNDPEIGDRIGVALIGGPAEGVQVRRATVEASILPSAQGAVIEPRADSVNAVFDHGNLIVSTQQGLIASAAPATPPPSATTAAQSALAQALMPQDATTNASDTPLAQVRAHIDDLTRRAAAEGTLEGAPTTARMELAKYLLENDFAPEALGALRQAAINQPDLEALDPNFRLMRGEANAMLGRVTDALADLNASNLRNDPSAALWRGYVDVQKQDWTEARQQLQAGAGALEQHSPAWRARFQLALSQAAFELGDNAAAQAAAEEAMGQATSQDVRLEARLMEARIDDGLHNDTDALTILDQLARERDEQVAVHAALEAIRIRRASGQLVAADAVDPLEALRYRWRGDSLELAIIGTLGDVYSELGRWREALATMRTAADRFPDDPAARQLRADMSTLFERLFLDGEADQLQPIQSLGLFYEFSDLTPVGANGDRMVRLLAGRLVKVDLLEQAETLLQHQVDERLSGIGKAQVAADLTAIYLMDDKPDQALVSINASRQPNMPTSLLAERRILEARALLGLGRLDGAVELVERDRGEDAQRVRAEAAWRARDWERAAVEIKNLLALRDAHTAMDGGDRQEVLRAGIALTLSGNDAGVRALYRQYAGDMAGTEDADAFEVVASGVQADGSAIRDVARAVARTDLLDRFMTNIRNRLTAEAADATPQPAAPGAPAPTPTNAPSTPAAPGPTQTSLPAPTRQTPAAAAAPNA